MIRTSYAAINKVQQTTNQGILFLPSGRYRVTKTVYMVAGNPPSSFTARPALSSSGSQHARLSGRADVHDFFRGWPAGYGRSRGKSEPGAKVTPPDASPGTFYSAMSNVTSKFRMEIPSCRSSRALCAALFLAHMISTSAPGLPEFTMRNVAYDLHFLGASTASGRASLHPAGSSPSWTAR